MDLTPTRDYGSGASDRPGKSRLCQMGAQRDGYHHIRAGEWSVKPRTSYRFDRVLAGNEPAQIGQLRANPGNSVIRQPPSISAVI